MAQKVHLRNDILLITTICCSLIVAINSCKSDTTTKKMVVAKNYRIDTTGIPHDTLLMSNKNLTLINGMYFLGNKKYSGIVKDFYPNGIVKSYTSIFQGMLHGRYKSFYENGNPFEVRLYKNNLSTGRHYGYWPESGILKFDYTYYEEKREGKQKKWYKSGKPFIFSNYVDDHEEGLQQAWRENGKLYINYVAKDGHTYGLHQTALCYKLIKQELETR